MTINKRTIIGLCIYLFIQIPLLIIGTNRRISSEEIKEEKLEINQGEYKLYNHIDGQEVGTIAIKANNDSYCISLSGNSYNYIEKYSDENISYDSIEVNDAILSAKEVTGRKVLRGKAGDNEIIILKYTWSNYLIADTIRDEYKIYYLILVLTPMDFETLIKKASVKNSNLDIEMISNVNSIYKAIFFWP